MTEIPYVELHCHSYYSLLDGASPPEELVVQAAALGYPALALTDHDGLYGIVRFWQAAQEMDIKAIIGAELVLSASEGPPLSASKRSPPIDSTPSGLRERPPLGDTGTPSHLTLLAETQQGYANLSRLISAGQLAGQKGEPSLTLDMLAEHAQGLICLSGCRQGAVASALLAKEPGQATEIAGLFYDIFGRDGFWIELQRHFLPTDAWLIAELHTVAQHVSVGLVATNNVHYARRPGQRLHDVLSCIRQHATLPEALAGGLLHPNSERFLKPPQEMAVLFADLPQAVRNTWRIAQRCNTSLDFSGQRLPTFAPPQGHTLQSYLRHLCEEKIPHRFESQARQSAQAQLDHELDVIKGTGLAGYFLTVWDIVRFAREQGIRCQGRGSAANSLVAYLLGITPVDPLRHNLLFERFLSKGAKTMPDIDIDFASDRREEVIQYVYMQYGEEHVGMVCNVVTYRARSALREVAKTLAFPPDVIDQAAKGLDTRSAAQAAEQLKTSRSVLAPADDLAPEGAALPWQLLSELMAQIDGVPRHLSIHVGGMLITAAPLVEIVPLERATMPGRVVVQWDKDSVEDAGLIKIDLLSLRTLGAVEEALDHIRMQRGHVPDIDHLSLDDPRIFELLRRADTVGCFQVESRAQAQMQPKLLAQRFEDIVISVALIRPGPIQGGMVHPFLRRRQGLEETTYLHPALEPALAETQGVIVFQEQVLRVAMAIANFSPAEADGLRRAMSRSRSEKAMAAMHERFLQGAAQNGVEREIADQIWHQLSGFAGFGFCKSHAAAFALVAYQTLYLKTYYTAEFFCALLNHQPLGFYPPGVLMGDAQRHGVPILSPDVNHSQANCTLETTPLHLKGKTKPTAGDLSIRLGLRYLHSLGEAGQERIVERRKDRPFQYLADFCRRTRLPRSVVENLIRGGALDGLPGSRREQLWQMGGLVYHEDGLDLDVPVMPASLPTLGEAERMAWEYELLGTAPGQHVMELYRPTLQAQGVVAIEDLETLCDGAAVRVAGMGVVRQRPPTAKGFLFVTLEDETGLANLIVRPRVYEQYRDALRNSWLLWAEGRLQREGEALSVLVSRAASLQTRR
jgi:error-prone DNA polymerase